MFRRPSKRQQLIKRVVVLSIMVISVLVIVTGAILFILGYRLDGDKGRLEQGALIQFDSTPSGAFVTIDGKYTNSRTATKQTVVAGVHSFIVARDGYQQWAKSLDLKAGTLTWLDYIRLVPKELKLEKVAGYPAVASEVASPDFKWLLVQEKADSATFHLVDLRAQDVKSSLLTLPADTYSEPATAGVTHSFQPVRWDNGGRYVLLKHSYNDTTEWIVLDTQDINASVNVTKLLNINLKDVQFSGTSGNILYGLANDGVIRKLDLGAATISRGLVTNVQRFDLFETNLITYVGSNPSNTQQQVAGIYREGDENPYVLRTASSVDAALSIDMTRYFSDDYIAISEGTAVTVLKGRYPSSANEVNNSLKRYATFSAVGSVEALSFSPDGDYLVTQSGLGFISYEIEYQRQTNAIIETTETTSHALKWLDDAYVWAVYDGHLSIREFDGSNVHVINAAEPGFDATLSQNGRYLYSIGKTDAGYQLQRVKLIID